ncbi:unnamed protein product [Blepharisma stoltei]|uniref:Uncharacterized protein n=1 Tax=Blepharisma stoltei TaxID=1481888 RepID=A0AAU9KJI6_9CILI|nr:unnamed protein product [Blepharisma stoltei]
MVECKMKGTNMRTVPYLGIYNSDRYFILNNDTVIDEIHGDLPRILAENLVRISDQIKNADEVEYYTIVHDGKELKYSYPSEVIMNLVMHPYVFYNIHPGADCKTEIKCGLYLPDSEIANKGIKNADHDWLCIDPNILNSNLFLHYHPGADESICFSPNNGRIRFLTTFPAHVFFTLSMIPFGDKYPRILICKHVLLIDDSVMGLNIANLALNGIPEIKDDAIKGVVQRFCNCLPEYTEEFSDIDRIIELVYSRKENFEQVKEFWYGRLFYYIWKLDGMKGDMNYGRNEYKKLLDKSKQIGKNEDGNFATEALIRYTEELIKHIIYWLEDI